MSVMGRCDECEQEKIDAIERPHPDNGNMVVLCVECFDNLSQENGLDGELTCEGCGRVLHLNGETLCSMCAEAGPLA